MFAEAGQPFEEPALINPHNVEIDKWYSSNPNIAEVNEVTGEVTIKAVGYVQIFCETKENETYSRGIFSYSIQVYTIGLKVKGITVTSAIASDILGDGSHAVYYEQISGTRYLHLDNWIFDATNADLALNAVIEDETSDVLHIILHGNNAIINAPLHGIRSENGSVIIMGNEGRGSLSVSATGIAVNAVNFKIHQCDVTVDGAMAGIVLGHELGISIGTHLMATSANYAIQAQSLNMADGQDGVAILTKNVIFKGASNQGFISSIDFTPAKEVEIGKVPVVVAEDEVTTIDFTQTDPQGNENVLFSTSINDFFNEETGQLEISTSLTDEVVAEALENFLPGSSAWLSFLPGTLVFDIPAGQGTIKIECLTLPGYTLNLKIEGQTAVTITQAEFGWANVEYDVPAPVHVVIYLHAESSNAVPARIVTRMEDAIVARAYIQAVKIAPAGAPVDPTAVENIVSGNENTQKVLLNGQLLILREGKTFNAQGTQVK